MEAREKALNVLKSAAEADQNEDLESALNMYKEGISALLKAIKCEF